MQQDRFHLAEQCLDQTPVSSNNEQLVSSGVESIESPEKFRKFSSGYWKQVQPSHCNHQWTAQEKYCSFWNIQFHDCAEGKTESVERECLNYTTVWLHEGKEGNKGSEGNQREERACSSTKTRGDPEKEIAFLQCKANCVCKGERCAALGLKNVKHAFKEWNQCAARLSAGWMEASQKWSYSLHRLKRSSHLGDCFLSILMMVKVKWRVQMMVTRRW